MFRQVKLRAGKKKIDLSKLTDEDLRRLGIDPTLSKQDIARCLKVSREIPQQHLFHVCSHSAILCVSHANFMAKLLSRFLIIHFMWVLFYYSFFLYFYFIHRNFSGSFNTLGNWEITLYQTL